MSERIDPYAGYNFAVELDGLTRAGFRSCSGLDISQEAGTYREGTDANLGMRKVPGLVTYGNITLSRGISNDAELWNWRRQVANGNLERHDISVTLLDDTGNAKIRWNLHACWPTKWTGPELDATADEFAIETLELACERIELDTWS